jgi:hypothetical protein
MSVIFKFLDLFKISSFAIVDIIRLILKAWGLKDILDLPPVIKRFTDKEWS